MVPPVSLVSGISATVLFATGWTAGIMCLVRYAKEEASLLLRAGILLMMIGTFYMGTVTSFFSLVTTGHNVNPPHLGAQLCYTVAPLAAGLSMNVGFTMLDRQKLAKWMPVAFWLTGPVYWYGLYVVPEVTILAEIPTEGGAEALVDFQLLSFVNWLTAAYLVAFLCIVAGAFYWMARQSSGFVRRRFYELAVGFTLFVFAGAIDSLLELGVWIVVPRFFMLTAYVLMYLGFTRTK
ncbi:MAG: hypothetical protein Kow0069_09070 [Promethearchaeota archaeon]